MKTSVAVLRGGPSSEYAMSLKTGAEYIRALPEDSYTARDVFIDTEGVWHARGIPMTPVQALSHTDVVLNALHGGMGEDGTVARFLNQQGIAYAGSRPIATSLAYNKVRARDTITRAGMSVPQALTFSLSDDLDTGEMASAVFAQFAPPYVVKPLTQGHSRGVQYVSGVHHLPDAIGDVLDAYGAALIEEYIQGEHISAHVLQDFRNQALYVFPVAHHMIASGERIISSRVHDTGSLESLVPSRHSHEDKQMLEDIARRVHTALGMQHMSQVDMIKTPRRTYVLEADTIPALHPGSPLPRMLESVGSSNREYVEHLIQLAMGV